MPPAIAGEHQKLGHLAAPRRGVTSDDGLAARLAWMTAARLALLTLLLVGTAFFYLRGDLARFPISMRIVFTTIGAAFGLAVVYAAILRSGKQLRTLAYAQVVLDQLTWTAIVYVSGGASSGATSFYALTCLIGAILVGLSGAATAAVVGLASYVLLCAGLVTKTLAPPSDQFAATYATNVGDIVYPLLVNGLGIGVVALLAGYLAERLRVAGGALAEATQRALEAEHLAFLGRIAAGLAHEIRNPLGSISGSIEMLRESSALSSEDKKLCDIVTREASRLNNLVSDMMDLARPRAPKAEAVDVAALAREVVALAARSERSGAGDVEVVYEGPEGPLVARCDGAQMRQVVWNLVRNAVQASAAGTAVTVRVEARDRSALLAVDDRGPGIAAEAKDRLFEEFYTTRSQGAGIGLAVVRRIMEDHAPLGARISVESPPSGGASFRISLPRDRAGAPAAYPRPSRPDA